MATTTASRRRRTARNSNAPDTAPDGGTTVTTATSATAAAAVATAPTAAGQGTNRETIFNSVVQSIVRALLLYAFLKYWQGGSSKQKQPRTTEHQTVTTAITENSVRSNLWGPNIVYEMRAFHSLGETMTFNDAQKYDPFYVEKDLSYTLDAKNYRSKNVSIDVPHAVSHQNASWFVHVFVARNAMWQKDPNNVGDVAEVLHVVYNIISWNRGALATKGKNLLSFDNLEKTGEMKSENGEQVEEDQVESGDPKKIVVSQMWTPVIPITLVTSQDALNVKSLPAQIAGKYRLADGVAGYYPPLYVNTFWLLNEMLMPMNSSVSNVILEMSFSPISMFKWTMFEQFEYTLDTQISYGASSSKEKDKMKRMFLDTNPILLGTTMAVSVAHSVLEALAFRNDISHWKSIKSMEGISVRSMIVKIFMEIIIFLYLWDNDTSWMIIAGNAIGIVIEIWKLCKAVEFKNFGKKKLLGFIPWFEMHDRASYAKKTKEYDDQAMKYLSYVSYPLIIGYSIYSLLYEKHKSWYSWILGSLVGTVYTFGFIMMFPQIFINYKLKSVAHLPMKAMMYKTLNTVIDDLFSFVIKMPWLHRLACFRDDFVFAIYLYQRWIYPVDKTRVNEFGQSFDEDGNEIVSETRASNTPAENNDSHSTTSATSEASKEAVGAKESVEPKATELKKNE